MIGKKDQPFSSIRINETYTSKLSRVISFSFCSAQTNDLIASESGRFVHRTGFEHVEPSVLFTADDEVGVGLFDAEQALEIEVSSVEHIDAASFENNLIEEVHVMDGSLGHVHEYRDGAGQINLSVQFNGGLGSSEGSPWKQRKTKIDSGGIHGVYHLLEIPSIGVFGIQSASLADEHLSECFIDSPVSVLVSVGEIGAGDVAANPHGIEMGATPQTGFDVAQALAESDLSEDHSKELVACGHGLTGARHRVEIDAALKLFAINQIGNLGKNEASGIHPLLRMNVSQIGQSVQMRDTSFFSLALRNE